MNDVKKAKINYDKFMLPRDSLITQPRNEVLGIDYALRYDIQSRNPRFSNLVAVGGTATGSGQITAGSCVVITTTISPAVFHDNDRILGIPFLAVYEGTTGVGTMQIYPALGSGQVLAPDKFLSHSGYDYGYFDNDNVSWSVTLTNTSGTTADIFVVTRWKYVKNNAGTSS